MSNLTGTYLFKDKDPIIDVMRTLIQTFANIEGLSFGKACKKISTKAGVNEKTMYGWFGGKTERPQYCNVARVILAVRHLASKPVAIGDRKVTAIGSFRARRAA